MMKTATRLTSNRASDALKQNEFTPLVKLDPAARVMWRREENLTPPDTSRRDKNQMFFNIVEVFKTRNRLASTGVNMNY
ncbi:hypothetical protein [Neomoorella humiferrea]|uniref:hypothetical protein n=1 Tax=Neomoorella humiferrea TaxID=676965 RepID=UPI001B800FB6|nr:hypothetical protein [Moorella humiferrea]